MRVAMLILLVAISFACEAGEKHVPLRNESGLTPGQIGTLLDEVKRADSKGDSKSCRPIGEADTNAKVRDWLATSSVDHLIHAVKAPAYVLDPRDVVLTFDVGVRMTWLVVTVRAERGHCVGYSLSTMYA